MAPLTGEKSRHLWCDGGDGKKPLSLIQEAENLNLKHSGEREERNGVR